MEQRRAHILHSLVKVEGELCNAKNTLLLVKELAYAPQHRVLCLDRVDSISLDVLLQLKQPVIFIVEHPLLCFQSLHHYVFTIRLLFSIFLLKLGLHAFQLTDHPLTPQICLVSLLNNIFLVLDLECLRATHICHEILYEALHLAIEVNVYLEILRLPLTITQLLRGLREQGHGLLIAQTHQHGVKDLPKGLKDELADDIFAALFLDARSHLLHDRFDVVLGVEETTLRLLQSLLLLRRHLSKILYVLGHQ